MMERMTMRLRNGVISYTHKYSCKDLAERLAYYEDLAEHGLPKLHVDQFVYVIHHKNKVAECMVKIISQLSDMGFGYHLMFWVDNTISMFKILEEEIGKTVFLTREEAEAKLKELEGK